MPQGIRIAVIADRKECTHCKRLLPLNAFHADNGERPSVGGRVSRCKECMSAIKADAYGGTPFRDTYDFARRAGIPVSNAAARRRKARARAARLSNQQLADSLAECRDSGRAPPSWLLDELRRRRIRRA